MMKGFKQFILRGSVIDLAVGVVIGASFGTVISSFVKDILIPFLGLLGGKANFSTISFTFNHSTFLIGDFFNNVLSFIIIAAVIYFFVVTPVNKLMNTINKKKPVIPDTKKCPFCISSIPLQAKKCAFCTIDLGSVKEK